MINLWEIVAIVVYECIAVVIINIILIQGGQFYTHCLLWKDILENFLTTLYLEWSHLVISPFIIQTQLYIRWEKEGKKRKEKYARSLSNRGRAITTNENRKRRTKREKKLTYKRTKDILTPMYIWIYLCDRFLFLISILTVFKRAPIYCTVFNTNFCKTFWNNVYFPDNMLILFVVEGELLN
jgi:hypothetical protein